MNKQIVNEFITAAQNASTPDVMMQMSMEDSSQMGYERVEYEFINKNRNGWKAGVNRELALRVYNRLCHCRDMEIELVWKRAVFMTAFLITCFAGYGGLIVAGLSRSYSDRVFFFVTATACFLVTIGFTVSVLWIMMCKGSKAWYEHYEDAIKAYSQKILEGEYVTLFSHNWKPLTKGKRVEMSNNLCSTHGGPYSVSQLAIFIGQLAALVWLLVLVAHGMVLVYVLWPVLTCDVWTFHSIIASVAWGLAAVVIVVVVKSSRYIAKSGYFGKLPQNEEAKESGEKKS